MRHWLLTSTTHGTWLPGDSRGSVTSVRDRRANDLPGATRIEHSVPGEPWEPPLPALYRSAALQLKCEPIFLKLDHAQCLLDQFRETAEFRDWILLAVAIMCNHFHLVVRVAGDPEPQKLLSDFKAYGTRALNRKFDTPKSETWWTEGGSKRKLSDERALKSAIHYVLHKQPNPLITWSPEAR